MKIIDAHTHLGSCYERGWHQKYDRIDDASVVEDFTAIGIDTIVTAPYVLTQGRMQEANRIALKAAKEFSGVVYGYITIVPFCGIDEVKNEIKKYIADSHFVGFKFLTGYHGEILQPEYEYAMDVANEMKCPVLVHEWGDIPKRSGIETAIKKRHNLKMVIAHQGGGSEEDTKACSSIIREYDNAYIELCGSLDNRLPVEAIVGLCGEDKVIFGTDMLSIDPKYELGRVMFAELSDEVKERVFALNYLKLLETSQMGHIA